MYRYNVNVLHIQVIIFGIIIAILMILGISMVLYGCKRGFETTYGVRLTFKQLPGLMKILVCIPLVIVIVFTVSLSSQEIQYINYEFKMINGDGIIVEGNVNLISYDESWYRDAFLGYNLSFEVNKIEYTPANSFPLEVVEKFRQGEKCRITYGYMGSELTVWSIDCLND